MNITIRKEERPVYLQIYKQMRNNILDGIFPFGGKLPGHVTGRFMLGER